MVDFEAILKVCDVRCGNELVSIEKAMKTTVESQIQDQSAARIQTDGRGCVGNFVMQRKEKRKRRDRQSI